MHFKSYSKNTVKTKRATFSTVTLLSNLGVQVKKVLFGSSFFIFKAKTQGKSYWLKDIR